MKSILILALSFITVSTQAQSLSGKIVDQDNIPMDLALVGLMSTTDSTFVKGEYTDVDGSYLISNVSAGNYILNVSMLGYDSVEELKNVPVPSIYHHSNSP